MSRTLVFGRIIGVILYLMGRENQISHKSIMKLLMMDIMVENKKERLSTTTLYLIEIRLWGIIPMVTD